MAVKVNEINQVTQIPDAQKVVSGDGSFKFTLASAITDADLQAKVDELNGKISDEQNSADSADGKVATYQQLLTAYAAYRDGNKTAAGDALGNVNAEYLDDESKKIYDAVNSEVNSEYLASTYQDAYQKYSSLNYAEAAAGFQKIIDMDENYHDGYALYYLAQSYRKNNDIDNARTYYQKVVELYPKIQEIQQLEIPVIRIFREMNSGTI